MGRGTRWSLIKDKRFNNTVGPPFLTGRNKHKICRTLLLPVGPDLLAVML